MMAKSKLQFGAAEGKPFVLPKDAATQKFAFLGRTGSGKTYAATKLAEEMLAAGTQVVVLDVVGVHWGLRLAGDGIAPGLDIPLLGGLRGDVPIESTAGALIADFIVDTGTSAILDISQFESDAEKARFAAAFADRFFFRKKAKPGPVHIFLEECQELVPQNIQKGEERMLHYWKRLAKLGRNFGIGVSLISQRPQEVNKAALNMTECMFAFQMRGTHERKTVKEWASTHDVDDDEIVDLLPKLPVGHAYVSSPQWLEFEGVVQVGKKWTYDSSSTPDFDAPRPEAGELAPIDLGALRDAMAATIEEQKANDPKELKRRIAELERDIEEGHVLTPVVDVGPAVDEAHARGYRAGFEEATQQANRMVDQARSYIEAVQGVRAQLASLMETFPAGPYLDRFKVEEVPADVIPIDRTMPRIPQRAVPPTRREAKPSANGSDPLGRKEREVLDAIAFYESIGQATPTQVQVAGSIGVSVKKSTWRGLMAPLRAGSYVEDLADRRLALTAAGRKLAQLPDTPPTRRDLHARVMSRLSGPATAVLQELIRNYPRGLTRDQVASIAGTSKELSTYRGFMAELRKDDLIEDRLKDDIAAAEWLFPKGLR